MAGGDKAAGATESTERGATLVGREAELGEAREAIADAKAGTLSMCLFVGPAGAGKTTLLRSAVELARVAGFRVLSCVPVAHEASLGYASLADLLIDVDRARVDRLPAPQRRALYAAIQEEDSPGPIPDHAAAAGLRSILDGLARDGPVCLAMDDLQWMDRSSLRALGFALRRLDKARVLVLGTRRQQATSGHLERDAPAGAHVRVIRPSPLTVAAMHHVLVPALGATFPRPTLVRITTLSNGNPLLAIELARSVLAAGGTFQTGQRAPLAGPNVRRLLGRRVADLSIDQRRTLLVAALVEGGSLQQARDVLDDLGWPFDPPDADTGLITIENAGITFGHPLYAEAILNTASPDDSAAVHRTIAARTKRVDARARHLAEASSTPDAEIAGAIDGAVTSALAAGATDEAVALSGLALERTPPHDPNRQERLLRHADVLLRSGDTRTGAALLERALDDATDPPLRVELLLRLANALSTSRPGSEVRALCEEAIRLAGGDTVAVAQAELTMSDTSQSPAEGLRHARRAIRMLGPSDPSSLRAIALRMETLWRSQAGRHVPAESMDEAVALEDLDRVEALGDSSTFSRAWLWLMADALDPARRDFELLRHLAADRGDEQALVTIDAQLGHLEIRAGNWARAQSISHEMLGAAQMADAQFWAGLAHLQLAETHGLSGDLNRAGQHLSAAESIATALGHPFLRHMTLAGRAILALGEGRFADATEFGLQARLVLAGQTLDPAMDPWPGTEAEAAARVGRLDEALALVGELERQGRTGRRRRVLAIAARCRAVIEASAGDLDAAVAFARTSVRTLSTMPVPFDHGRSLLVLGSIQRRRREKRAADESLTQALQTFERLGAVAWIRQTEAERARVGLRPRAPLALTEGELRIAQLAASGRSNREIAQDVFLSEKTVEANLARAYQKLGIRRRAELGTRLAERMPPAH